MLANKYIPQAPSSLLQPIPPPIAIEEDVGLDIVASLPAYHGYTIIVVIINCFSKVAHFGMLPTKFFAYKRVELFTTIFCKLHK